MKVTTIYGTQICAGAQQRKDGVYLFDEDGKIIICLDLADILGVENGEIVVVEVAEPTAMEALEAQLAYTAMMTDTLLEDFV